MVPLGHDFRLWKEKKGIPDWSCRPIRGEQPLLQYLEVGEQYGMSWLLNSMTMKIGENFMCYKTVKEI